MRTTATFADQAHAAAAIAELRTRGVTDDHMSIIGRDGHQGEAGIGQGIDGDKDRFMDAQGDQELNDQGQRHAARGLIGGGALGGLLGVAMLAIPGVGPFMAAGTIAAMLTGGVALGAGLGGLREILTTHGYDEQTADALAQRIDAGDVLVSVDADADLMAHDAVEDIVTRNGGTLTMRQTAIA